MPMIYKIDWVKISNLNERRKEGPAKEEYT